MKTEIKLIRLFSYSLALRINPSENENSASGNLWRMIAYLPFTYPSMRMVHLIEM